MTFIPETEDAQIKIPFYEKVKGRSKEGWSGHTTEQTMEGLESGISSALGRLGAVVTGFRRGKIQDEKTGLVRRAIRIHYAVPNEHGDMWPGEIVIAALPVDRKKCRTALSYEKRVDKSLRMAMYMVITALQGSWNMRILSPGFSPLMPWMLTAEGETFSQKWEQTLSVEGITKLLPEPEIDSDASTVNGEFKEV